MIPNQNAEIGGKTTYQKWLEGEGIPVIRDFHIADIRDVAVYPWERKGGLDLSRMFAFKVTPGTEIFN